LLSVETNSLREICNLDVAEFQLNSAGDIPNLTPNLLSGQWQGRGPLSAAIQMAGIPTGLVLLHCLDLHHCHTHSSLSEACCFSRDCIVFELVICLCSLARESRLTDRDFLKADTAFHESKNLHHRFKKARSVKHDCC